MNIDEAIVRLATVLPVQRVLIAGTEPRVLVEGLRAHGVDARGTNLESLTDSAKDAEAIVLVATQSELVRVQELRDCGFSPDLEADTSYLASHAMLLRRGEQPFPDAVLRLYFRFLDQQAELAAAAELQARVEVDLATATREIELLAGLGSPARETREEAPPTELMEDLSNAIRSHSASLKAMNFRLQALEQQNAHLATGLTNITESKIWRTLVRAAGVVQKLLPR